MTDLKVDSDLITQFDTFFEKLTNYCHSCIRKYLVRVLTIITKFASDALKNLILQVSRVIFDQLINLKINPIYQMAL